MTLALLHDLKVQTETLLTVMNDDMIMVFKSFKYLFIIQNNLKNSAKDMNNELCFE